MIKIQTILMGKIIILFLLTTALLYSCVDKNSKKDKDFEIETISKNKTTDEISVINSDNDIDASLRKKLPESLFEQNIISNGKINNNFEVDLRIRPFYLKEDFNGDRIEDIALPIKDPKSGKVGFAIIHGKTKNVYIIGAGKMIKNAISDDMDYIDIWNINREKEVVGTEEDENGDLIDTPSIFLKSPSIKIEKSELGGGLIFWNGEEYQYLHQTC